MKRWEIINKLIGKFNYGSYLEIGISDGTNFKRINAHKKIGVDPDPSSPATYCTTSDRFFEKWEGQGKFDLIFIDGLHHWGQVITDISNSKRALNPSGTIVVHDCNPTTELMQRVPRAAMQWTGDTWKAWIKARIMWPGIPMFVVDTDYGVGVIRDYNPWRYGVANPKAPNVKVADLTYNDIEKNRVELLNLISVREFEKLLTL